MGNKDAQFYQKWNRAQLIAEILRLSRLVDKTEDLLASALTTIEIETTQ